MITLINAIVLAVIGFLAIVITSALTKQHIPKGLKEVPKSKEWPLFRLLFFKKEPRFVTLFRLKKKLGPIFKFTIGCREIIVFNTSSIMIKTLREMGNNFAGRWQNIIVQTLHHNAGLLFKDREWWAIQRSFVLKVLRDFGLGKQKSQEIVNQECSLLLKEIDENCGKMISARYLFPKYMVNVISKLVMNIRFERSDRNFQALTALIEKHAHNHNWSVTIMLMFPILERMPILSRLLLKISGREKETSEGSQYIRDIILEHEQRFNPDSDCEDLIDMFIREKRKLDDASVKNHTFTDWQLIREVYELFAAGYETTSTTLSWSMMLLAKHPDIQEKFHREIIDVIGTSRSPTLADKTMLTYTQAVMDEILRVSSVVPLSLPHRVFETTVVDGFFIPKNSIIYPNIYGIHHDNDTWEKPFEFYPEHFLTITNNTLKYTPRDELMPFSIGKRQCLGESLARLELFTFLTSILQRFRITFSNPMTAAEFKRITVGTGGTIRAPLNTDIVFELWQN